MFDGKQIAKQALLRAEELERSRKIRQARLRNISALSLSAMALAVVLIVNPFGGSADDYTTFDDHKVPLADFPLTHVDANSRPYFGEELNVTIPEIGSVKVPAGSLVTDAQLYNPQANTCSFIFEIILADNGECLYKSEPVAPGMCIEAPELAKPLAQGSHDAVLRIHFAQPDTFIPVSSVDSSITLIVE